MNFRALLKYFPYFLVVYHLSFAWFAYDYVNQNNGDAVKYWFIGKNLSAVNWTDFLHPGTDAIKLLTFPFVKFLHLPGWAGCLIFSMGSGFGFWKLWSLLKNISSGNKYLLGISMILLLLPNAHFWTSLIGKEAVLFVPAVLIAEQIYKKQYFSLSMILSFLVIAWIRPHVAFIFLAGFLIAILWKGEIKTKTKAILSGFVLLFSAGLYWILARITHSKESLFIKIQNLYAAHNLKLKDTSAYVPMEDYVYPYKLFTFYFRPLPFEKEGVLGQIIGLENGILMVLFIVFLFFFIRNFKVFQWNVFSVFATICILIYGTVFAYGYANFGMIIRTKTLVFPLLLIFGISLLSQMWKKRNPTSF